MALSVGELEATLRLRDELSASVKTAQASVTAAAKGMSEEFASVGAQVALANNYIKQFAGGDTIAKANAMSQALQATGGAATLTANEQRGVNQQVTEAIAKYKALGKDAPPSLLAIQKQTAASSSTMGDLGSMALRVGAAVGIGFSVQKVIQFGKAILDDADMLVKLHDKTNISLQGLQRMRIAGDDASVSLESMTSAVNLMQKRLAGDDKSAVAALAALGLNLKQIRSMEPDQQFMAIGEAIKGVKDPAEQVNLAMAVFGRSGAELLPVIKRGFDDVKNASVGMSDSSIKAFDDLGDTIARWARSTKAVIGDAVGIMLQGGEVQAGANAFMATYEQILAKIEKHRPVLVETAKTVALSEGEVALAEERLTEIFKANEEAQKKVTEAAKRHTEALDAEIEEFEKYAKAQQDADYLKQLEEEAALIEDVTSANRNMAYVLRDLQVALPLVALPTGQFVGYMEKLPQVTASGAVGVDTFKKSIEGVKDALTRIPDLLKQAFTSGGNLIGAMKAIGVDIAESIMGPLLKQIGKVRSAAVAAGSALSSGLGQAAGLGTTANTIIGVGTGLAGAALAASTWGTSMAAAGVAGSVALGAATLGIGTAAVAAGVLIKKWWDHKKAVQESQKAVGEFEQQMWATLTPAQAAEAQGQTWAASVISVRDAYLATGRSATQAEADVAALWASSQQGAAATQAAIDKINAAFIEQKQDAVDLDAAIQKYGFSIEQLGPAMQRQKLTEQAMTLMNDFRLLAGSGIDVGVVLDKMGGSINEFLSSARKTGTEIPTSMQPMLQKMIDTGTLLDENGKAITDLGESGLTFSETMTQGFDRIVKKFDELLKTIGMVPTALAAIVPPVIPDVHFDIIGDYQYTGENLDYGGAQASGGDYIVNKPTMFLAGEAGSERVSFSGATRAQMINGDERGFADAGSVVRELQDLKAELRWQRRTVPSAIRDALQRSRAL
jgi:hypothetical protein